MSDDVRWEKDPITGEIRVRCEVYSRIVGYLTPTMNWNKGKLQEFKRRKVYEIKRDKE